MEIFYKCYVSLRNDPIEDGTQPVSYTHLDVYKRQVLGLFSEV